MDKRVVALMILLAMNSAPTRAIDPLYHEVADYVGVPVPILYAMSQAESGLLTAGRFTPWPWTLNVAGEAQRYEDRQSMFKGLMEALGTGELMIDVGPMQVNWYWQFNVMGSPWRITDPAVNIKIAAEILKTHYQRSGDWWEAVGRYHRPADSSRDRQIAEKYRQRVRHFFEKLKAEEVKSDAA